MPLFRLIAAPPDLEDAQYLYATNPDPARYEEVVDKPAKKAATAPAAAESVPESQE